MALTSESIPHLSDHPTKADREIAKVVPKAPQNDPYKADFRNFVYAVWHHLDLPDPTQNQYEIAQWLSLGPRRLITEAFRGVGKSWLTVAFVLWTLCRDPQMKIMVVSANAPKANEFSTFCFQLINDMPMLAFLKPRADQRQSMQSFDVGPAKPDQSPSVKSVGITGQLTGSRANLIVADDIEVPQNSDTQGKRDRLLELVKEFDAVLKPGGRIIYLGTPQTEQSIYNTLPSRGYVTRIWTARYPKDPDGKLDPVAYAERKYGAKLAPRIMQQLRDDPHIAGTSQEPSRFPDEDLRERQLSYGRAGFALQFMLDTSLSDADKFPLKLNDLIVFPLDPYRAPIDFMWASSPELVLKDLPVVGLQGDRYHAPAWFSRDVAPYEAEVMFVDPSGRGKDETSYAIIKLLHGRLFLVASGGFLSGYDEETLKGLLMVAKKHGVRRILTEPNYGGGMFTQLLKSAAQKYYHEAGIEDAEWSSVAKEQRIVDTLEPILAQHRLVVCPSVIEADYTSVLNRDGERVPYYRLFYQLSHMVRERGALAQDDRLDALAGAVAYFTEQVSRDTEAAAIQHKEDLLEAELEKFVEGVLFGRDGGRSRQMASSTLRNLSRRH
jgi:hypothetical protein